MQINNTKQTVTSANSNIWEKELNCNFHQESLFLLNRLKQLYISKFTTLK